MSAAAGNHGGLVVYPHGGLVRQLGSGAMRRCCCSSLTSSYAMVGCANGTEAFWTNEDLSEWLGEVVLFHGVCWTVISPGHPPSEEDIQDFEFDFDVLTGCEDEQCPPPCAGCNVYTPLPEYARCYNVNTTARVSWSVEWPATCPEEYDCTQAKYPLCSHSMILPPEWEGLDSLPFASVNFGFRHFFHTFPDPTDTWHANLNCSQGRFAFATGSRNGQPSNNTWSIGWSHFRDPDPGSDFCQMTFHAEDARCRGPGCDQTCTVDLTVEFIGNTNCCASEDSGGFGCYSDAGDLDCANGECIDLP